MQCLVSQQLSPCGPFGTHPASQGGLIRLPAASSWCPAAAQASDAVSLISAILSRSPMLLQ